MSFQKNMQSSDVCAALAECFDVRVCGDGYAIIDARPGWESCFKRLSERLVDNGVQIKLQVVRGQLVALFIRVREGWSSRLLYVLAAVTLVSVFIAGFDIARIFASIGFIPWSYSSMVLAFAFGILAPLALHESGHYLVARIRGVPASPPLFIPAPPPSLGGFGTFGAIIKLRGLPYDRESLAWLGIAGPLAGFLAALVACLVGAKLSVGLSEAMFRLLEATGRVESIGFTPLIVYIVVSLVGPRGAAIIPHPLLLASIIVFLVTFLNLLPIGQLDGGHVVYAVFGERVHQVASNLTPIVALLVALLYPQLYFVAVFAIFAYVFNAVVARGARHPGVLNPYAPLRPSSAFILASLYTLLLVLTAPIPY